MVHLPIHIEQRFYNLILGNIELEEFESWVYTDKELETALPTDDYLELISFNYKKSGAKYEMAHLLLEKFVDRAKYEKWRVLNLLYTAQKRDKRLPDILRQFYDLYCKGYGFLRDLGIGYGLMIEVPPSKYKAETWEEMSEAEKKELIRCFYPQLNADIQRVIDWVENDKIIFKDTVNEMGCNEYTDLRTEDEKISTVWTIVEDSKSGENNSKIEENPLTKEISDKPNTTIWAKLKSIWS